MSAVMTISKFITFDDPNFDKIDYKDWYYKSVLQFRRTDKRVFRRINRKVNKFLLSNPISSKAIKGYVKKNTKYRIEMEGILTYNICWYQSICGDLIKEKFFDRKTTYIFCDSKKSMIKVLNKYLNFKRDDALSVYYDLINKWQDGYLFEMSW